MNALFDAIADEYDAWYDEPDGRAILAAELACLRRLVGTCRGRWLEVGVGTGRFAAGMGIGEGIDPAARMLGSAARRGVHTCLGTADSLPFPDGSLDGVLLALTLCFIDDPAAALRECRRVLTRDGVLLVPGACAPAHAVRLLTAGPGQPDRSTRGVPLRDCRPQALARWQGWPDRHRACQRRERSGLASRRYGLPTCWKVGSHASRVRGQAVGRPQGRRAAAGVRAGARWPGRQRNTLPDGGDGHGPGRHRRGGVPAPTRALWCSGPGLALG